MIIKPFPVVVHCSTAPIISYIFSVFEYLSIVETVWQGPVPFEYITSMKSNIHIIWTISYGFEQVIQLCCIFHSRQVSVHLTTKSLSLSPVLSDIYEVILVRYLTWSEGQKPWGEHRIKNGRMNALKRKVSNILVYFDSKCKITEAA